MDHTSAQILTTMNLPNLHVIPLEKLEQWDNELVATKPSRSLVEYYFTCTPSLPLYILDAVPEVDMITYLDADLFFFAHPKPIFDEMDNHSIAIIGHRFPPETRHLERAGIYNVGWLSFRRDDQGIACLKWWRERCIEWCYDRFEDGRFADQKYLDYFPTLFQNLVVLQHKGANVAPWNLANYTIHSNDGTIWIDEHPLIFFHFHGLRKFRTWFYTHALEDYHAIPTKMILGAIYRPYIRILLDSIRQVAPLTPKTSLGSNIRHTKPPAPSVSLLHPKRLVRKILEYYRDFQKGRYIFVGGGFILHQGK